ncbi:hypothetical protein K493DRAFT_295282 [Basidiobolus meristosporus CBS 931.73]|uniref:DUF4436 domain-containing protein n=1 Tax=Basidiobolus meristosporus CBS 931.73 TaxID=1314790 RepID=A0A1Y1ZCA0_9FUNG|nr:hypothetical protein K493DRAFT_295282 [Basidiobolus meristosporus CBS 931.73]|eukprot:ORY07836.1 hypothetical protein K493DRAFT_295282 [Basidiobolus meristosporus CBS 931.73]
MKDLRRIFPNFYSRRLAYAGISAILICSIVVPVFIVYLRKGPRYNNTQYGSASETRLDLMITVVSVDSVALKSQLSIDFLPLGNLVTEGKLKLSDTITVNFLHKSFTFPQNSSSILPSGEISVPFYEGNRRNYPFDVYEANLLLYAFIPNTNDDIVVPISASFTANVQNFEIFPVFSVQNELNTISFTAQRSTNTKAFSICVIILMWALSLGISSLAFQIVVLKREIQPPIMALGVSMLFSLPALRNTQPGIPGIGCAADMISFFWNMFLVAISAIGFIWTYSATWTRPPQEQPSPSELTATLGDACQTSFNQKNRLIL